jgi:hypothetical protein
MHPDWLRDLRDLALTAGIALFVKQLGSNRAAWSGVRHFKGEDPAEWPADMRIQDFRVKDRRPRLATVTSVLGTRRASASARTCREHTCPRARAEHHNRSCRFCGCAESIPNLAAASPAEATVDPPSRGVPIGRRSPRKRGPYCCRCTGKWRFSVQRETYTEMERPFCVEIRCRE